MPFGGKIFDSVKNAVMSYGRIMKPVESAEKLTGLYANGLKGNIDQAEKLLAAKNFVQKDLQAAGLNTKKVAESMAKDAPADIEAYQHAAYRTQTDDMIKHHDALVNSQGSGEGKGFFDKTNAIMGDKGVFKGGGSLLKEYYWGEGVSGKDKAIRIGSTYAAGALGGRVLSGGGLTTNNQGERDIAGIPFF